MFENDHPGLLLKLTGNTSIISVDNPIIIHSK